MASNSIGQIDLDLGLNYKQFNKQLSGISGKANSLVGGAFKKLGGIIAGAFAVKGLIDFGKASVTLASDLMEVQNVVNVTFGSMAEEINQFSKTAITSFGLSELSAKRFTSTMGAMLKSSGLTGKQLVDMSKAITALAGDMASFYNLNPEEAFHKIRSGLSGEVEPLRQLGINLSVANLEAYALSKGITKSYQAMTQAEQTLLRYNYLLEVTKDAQGDFVRTSGSWANQLKILREQWKSVQATMGQAFITILTPVIKGLNLLVQKLQIAANYFKAFVDLIYGASKTTVSSVSDAASATAGLSQATAGVGKSAKKAGKDIQNALTGFDEIHSITQAAAGSMEELSGGMGGGLGIEPVDLGASGDTSFTPDIDTSVLEQKFNNLHKILLKFYNNWGIRDIFEGIKAGIATVDFTAIKDNLGNVLSGLGTVAQSFLMNLQPIFQSSGQLLGTVFRRGIELAGNLFEPMALGFSQFVEGNKAKVQEWLSNISETIASGINDVKTTIDIITGSWSTSIEKAKGKMASLVTEALTIAADFGLLIGKAFADSFKEITQKVSNFVGENKTQIQGFTDDIVQIFTDGFGFANTIAKDLFNDLQSFWDRWGLNFVGSVTSFVTDLYTWFLYLWNDLIMPLWQHALDWLKLIWDGSLHELVQNILAFIGKVTELLDVFWNTVLKPLVDAFIKNVVPSIKNALMFVMDIFGIVFKSISDIVNGFIITLTGLIDFLIGIFTGDWKRAWEGIKNVFRGIVKAIEGIFKGVINGIIAAINTFIRGVNRIKIPKGVPGVGGLGFNIPQIPYLAKGAIIDSPTLAMVGEKGKEAVIPLENTEFVNTLATAVANSVGNVMAALLQFYNNTGNSNFENKEIVLTIDSTEIARITLPAINDELERQGYKPILQY